MKIDVFSHIFPPKYKDAFYKRLSVTDPSCYSRKHEASPALADVDFRCKMIEQYQDVIQVISVSLPSLEILPNPGDAAEVARVGNDEIAEIVTKYPHHFIAGVATLPLIDIEATLRETDRAIKDLGLRGVLITSNVKGKQLDSPEYMPLYEKMAEYDLPIWIHPQSLPTMPGYKAEDRSQYGIYEAFGWPMETAVAMTRLACSGILEKYPNLKFITHHCGGMIPFYAARFDSFYRMTAAAEGRGNSSISPSTHLRLFYADTVVNGSVPSLMCGYSFFGVERIVFGTDAPFYGKQGIPEVVSAIEAMDISDAEKKMIFENNARKLLRLSK